MQLALIGLAGTLFATGAIAAPSDPCVAFEATLARAIHAQERASKGTSTITLNGIEGPEYKTSVAKQISETAQQSARFCIGSLASQSRFGEATDVAVRAGMLDEAVRLAELAKLRKASP